MEFPDVTILKGETCLIGDQIKHGLLPYYMLHVIKYEGLYCRFPVPNMISSSRVRLLQREIRLLSFVNRFLRSCYMNAAQIAYKSVNGPCTDPCTLRPIYFFIFPTKTEKGHITYPYHFSIFQSTEKKRKKENGQ